MSLKSVVICTCLELQIQIMHNELTINFNIIKVIINWSNEMGDLRNDIKKIKTEKM